MAYDENIRIIAEELERLKNRPTGDKLPEVETTDEGKVLTVNSSGEWDAEDIPNQLPAVESTDEGKVLTVNSSGEWAVADPSSSYDLDYSTTEKYTGMKWIDGTPVYQKTINIGTIESGQYKSVAHSISNFGRLIDYAVTGYNSTESAWNTIPRVDNDASYQRGFTVDSTNIMVTSGNNSQELINCYATIYYTKSTQQAKKKGAK